MVIHGIDAEGLRRPVGMLTAGMAYGVTSLWLREPRDATVTATGEVRLWAIHRDPFQALVAGVPGLARALDVPVEVRRALRAPAFAWLEPGEAVTYYSHRHWLWYVYSTAGWTLLVGLYAAILIAAPRLTDWSPEPRVWGGPAAPVYVLVLAWYWIDWRNDYLLITTRRVAHRERVALLYESRYEAPLGRVQNINIRRGLLGSLFGYGDLSVETAAKVGRLHIERIPRPERAREAIFAQQARVRATQQAAERAQIEDTLGARLGAGRPGRAAPPAPISGEEPAERALEGAGEGQPTAVMEPGRLLRALEWLALTGILPATRMATPEGIVWRRHWIFLLSGVTRPALLALLCGGLAAFGASGLPTMVVGLTPAYPLIMGALAVFGVGWTWWEANDWSNDLYVVTDERIIDIDKRPLFFAEERREAPLGMIQNVSSEMPSFWAAVLNYGDVLVQTAGAGEFTFEQVPDPREVQREVFRRMEAFRERQRRLEAEGRRHEFADWLAAYDRIREAEPGDGSGGGGDPQHAAGSGPGGTAGE